MVRRCEELGVERLARAAPLREGHRARRRSSTSAACRCSPAHPTDPQGWQFAVKYAIDRLRRRARARPALARAARPASRAAVLSLGRPILFRQRRVGRDGRTFDMLKFRSMRCRARRRRGSSSARRRAPGRRRGRRTAARASARFLRRSSLDELPQLFNVLRGEMSLVGPRPERPELVELLRRARPPLRRPPPRQVGHHRLGAGPRPARQDLARRPRRVGQLLHRELVALARREDPAADRARHRPPGPGRVRARGGMKPCAAAAPWAARCGVLGCARSLRLRARPASLHRTHPGRRGGEASSASSSERQPPSRASPSASTRKGYGALSCDARPAARGRQ